MRHVRALLIWLIYWTLVFGVTSVFVHETWPWGLLMIPIAALYIRLLREFERHATSPTVGDAVSTPQQSGTGAGE